MDQQSNPIPIYSAYVDDENNNRYFVQEFRFTYAVKCATQIDAVIFKESKRIIGKGARLYASRIRKVVDQFLTLKGGA